LSALGQLFARGGRFTVGGAPEGRDALALAALMSDASDSDMIFIARDDARMAAMAEALALLAPAAPILTFPAWDCLPYDRVSPNGDICARRLHTLTTLADRDRSAGLTLLTTCNAMLQRVPKRSSLAGARLQARVGDTIDFEALTAFLVRNGYGRSGTVMEPGEYAFRGGIVDLFPPGWDQPVRLDLFGETVETVRIFDPLSQRSAEERDGFVLVPVSEVVLDDDSIARFRSGYRLLFGAMTGDEPLYESVSAGRRHPGMEHWLPLFHDGLETVFDYLPDARIALDHLLDEARAERLATIDDYHAARRDAVKTSSAMAGPPYRPVPPETLFLSAVAWERHLGARAVATFSPYRAPEQEGRTLDLGGRRARDFAPERKQPDANLFDAVGGYIDDRLLTGRQVVVACYTAGSRDRMASLLRDHGIESVRAIDRWAEVADLASAVGLVVLGLGHGFETDELVVLSEQDVLGDRLVRRPRRARRAANFLSEASSLAQGDIVVHTDHGIGRFEGLETLEIGGAPHDCLKLIYAGDDRLFVPVENIEVLSRHGSGDGAAPLDRLGSAAWQARKAKLKKRLRDMANELIDTAARRLLKPAEGMTPPQGLYEEFCARFPYVETDDQSAAIVQCLDDLAVGKSMDRLVCGDVGFGKTEVAMRAAFIAAFAGKQVAVVVPTTLLCRQHHQTFTERFAGLPVNIGQLSRLVSAKDAAEVRDGLAGGTIDIVIGTHALLGKSAAFKALGLLIIDEEQHFGVAQKERLKALKADVHVITLTATPIPRTLQLALSGVRDLSIIATPPVDRLAVRTFVLPYDPVVIREAIMREHYRGGQTFYICPRIEDLDGIEAELGRVVPEIKIAVAHGRMAPTRLEAVMSAFYDGAVDLLLSTSIIESGLDIPTANTLIVHRSDRFGLAQLYQLRGRVGRSKPRAYAYFTVPAHRILKGAAAKRLDVLQTLDSLGAGFALASHDMDIRGAGNLLGEEQSGHIREVGVELYQTLLEEAVHAARGEAAADEQWSPQIAVGASVMIPDEYVADLGVRMGLYRRIASLAAAADIDNFAAELIDRFGALPDEVDHLLQVVRIKQSCRAAGVEKIEAGPKGAVIAFRGDSFAAPERLIGFITDGAGDIRLRPDHKLVVARDWRDPVARMRGVGALVEELAGMAA
jgi:transcription-repair coupling factor (superfamily II helicase)